MRPAATPRFWLSSLTIRSRLGLIQLSLLAALLVVSTVAWHVSESERRAGHRLAVLSRAERNHIEANAMLQALLGDVEEALRVDAPADESESLANAKTHVRALEGYLGALRDPQLPPGVAQRLEELSPALRSQANAALALAEEALRNRADAVAREPELHTRVDELIQRSDGVTLQLTEEVTGAERGAFADASRAEIAIISICSITALLAFGIVALISKSVRQSLGDICDAARALAAGNLSARSPVQSSDEVGELALSLNKMADDLQRMVDRLLAEAHRDAFGAQVTRALEMAESETDVRAITSRALPQVGEKVLSELLLTTAGKELLEQVAVNPVAGAPGCPVETLSGCTAVRRGAPTTFESSEALDACPRLRARLSGPLSATCVPVSFMGKAVGVLHAASADHKPPNAHQQTQLATLGVQIGARIGSLRAVESTRVYAYTDPLTGLGNRRAMEQASAEILRAGKGYALAIADLDHFKRLNDLQGHEAGDQALKLFADVLRKSIRQADRAARWGGEEFAILFPESTAAQASEVIERLRSRLESSLKEAGRTRFTASFGVADSGMAGSIEAVMRLADEALYESKKAGRDLATVASGASRIPEKASERELLGLLEQGQGR